jgi:hypothetical protein
MNAWHKRGMLVSDKAHLWRILGQVETIDSCCLLLPAVALPAVDLLLIPAIVITPPNNRLLRRNSACYELTNKSGKVFVSVLVASSIEGLACSPYYVTGTFPLSPDSLECAFEKFIQTYTPAGTQRSSTMSYHVDHRATRFRTVTWDPRRSASHVIIVSHKVREYLFHQTEHC